MLVLAWRPRNQTTQGLPCLRENDLRLDFRNASMMEKPAGILLFE